MMNENNDVFTMEDEPIASVVQDGREGALPGNGAARGTGSELPQAAGVRRFHEKVNG